MILLKNKDKKANIKSGNNIEIKDGNDFPFDLTLYGRSTQETSTNPVSPSPDYPSPIESVGRKNLFDKDNTTILQCYFDGSHTSLTSASTNTTTYCKVMPNTTYNVSKLRSIRGFIGTTQTLPDINTTVSNILNIGSGDYDGITRVNGTITTGENDNYIVINYSNTNTETGDIPNNILDSIQIEKGTVATDYVPYEHTEISATVTGKNLLENKTKNSGINRGITFTLNGDGSYTLNGTNDGTGNSTVFLSSSSNPTTLKAGTYYTIPTPNGVHITGAKIGGGYLQLASSSTNQFTLNEDTQAQIYIQVPNGITTTYNNIKVYPMISTTPITQTDYEEYKSNSLVIDLQGNELCSLPNGTKDEVNITNGEALLNKKLKKVVFDGSDDEIWTISDADGLTRFSCSITGGLTASSRNQISSNYFKFSANTNEVGIGFVYLSRVYLYPKSDITTVDEFKTWLSTHNTEVLYELAEPETIDLGIVEMPHTYEGFSNITNSADTEMVVKYYKKFEFDKILRNGYNIDEQEHEIAKKQMANGKRKKILSSYVDCIIKINLGLLDNKTYQEYKEQLEDGEYEYFSYRYNQYKKANFILTKPSINTEYAYDDDIGIDDMEITLEKSSDVL